MITVDEFLQTIDYEVTSGEPFCWNCFGPDARFMCSDNQTEDGRIGNKHTISIVFDSRDLTVYQMEALDYVNNNFYRWTHPDWNQAYKDEVASRGLEELNESSPFIELETQEDMLEKARAIHLGEEYDDRISIPLNIDDAALLLLMKEAHRLDMTFNEFVTQVISDAVARETLGKS